MQNLLEDLTKVLQKDARLVKDGKLFKNKIIELALQLDHDLISLLLKISSIRNHFFHDVGDVTVFDKTTFTKFVSNKSFLPDNYTSFKNKIGLMSDDVYLADLNEVVLGWPFKDCVLEGDQSKEDKKRNELFWNVTLASDQIDRLLSPKVLTNFKKYDSKGSHSIKEIISSDNLIIKGNNLLAVHSLKKVYSGRIKLIYLDPPYNTGNDSFRYNDSFNHSTWLTFMKNRLEVSRELLSKNGFLTIQIDNKEAAYLKILLDEVYGRENYRNAVIVKKGTKSLQKQFTEIQQLNAGYDTIFIYSNSAEVKIPNLFKQLSGESESAWNNHWRGTDRPTMRYKLFGIKPKTGQWRWEQKRTERAVVNYQILVDYIKNDLGKQIEITDTIIDKYYKKYLEEHGVLDNSEFELVRLSKNNKPEHYIPPRMDILLSENWMDLSVAGRVTEFEHEKNEEILRRIIKWLTSENDIVLDFFLGSGTTTAVAHKLRRRYIGIEQLDYGKEDSIERLKSVIAGDGKGISEDIGWEGGGSFISCELFKLNEGIISASLKMSSSQLDKLIMDVIRSPYLSHKASPQLIKDNLSHFRTLGVDDKRKAIRDILEMNQLYLAFSEIEDEDHGVTAEDRKLNSLFYSMKVS